MGWDFDLIYNINIASTKLSMMKKSLAAVRHDHKKRLQFSDTSRLQHLRLGADGGREGLYVECLMDPFGSCWGLLKDC